ncbi:MAG TPA: fibronectin type III domain-containing protein [bacterium]|nr:fibronectin type III domain-containing protein [bacterium]
MDPIRFSRAYLSSTQTSWPWAAGLEQILRYYGLDVTQEEISRRIFGQNLDGSTRTNDVLNVQDIINKSMKYWTADDLGRPFTAKTQDWKTHPTAQVLLAELSAQHPLLALLRLPDQEQYEADRADQTAVDVVVIDGGDFTSDGDGNPRFNSIEVRDPAITRKDPRNPGFVTLTPLQVRSEILEFWTIRVSAGAPVSDPNCLVVESPFRQAGDRGQIVVRGWQRPSSGVSGYNVYMSDLPGSGFRRVNQNPITGTAILIKDLTLNRPYYFCLTSLSAQMPAVESRPSGVFHVLAALPNP